MTNPPSVTRPGPVPDLSIVMPCYNEEAILAYTMQRLLAAFARSGHILELITVDNGSRDRTGEIIREFAAADPRVVHHRVEVNQGYGYGVLMGLPLCRARWTCIIPADGQVDAEDVVRLYETIASSDGNVLGKVRRRFRMDGLWRKIVSVSYNMFVVALWPGLGSIDVNGSPKILPTRVIPLMELESKDWFLDPEIMIKAHTMGLRVLEFNVFARLRANGTSHVRASTCWEFFRNLLAFRFGKKMARWKQEVAHRANRLATETGSN
jgi:glycosyltransferase involved in cell wall biosynthesis